MIKKRLLAILMGMFSVLPVAAQPWSTEGVPVSFVQDARWATLSDLQKDIMIHIFSDSEDSHLYAINKFEEHPQEYATLANKYDLLKIVTQVKRGFDVFKSSLAIYLFSRGVDISESVIVDNITFLEALLEHGLNPNFTLQNGDTLLVHVINTCKTSYFNVSDSIRLLLQYGADPLLVDKSGKNAYENFEILVQKGNYSCYQACYLKEVAKALYQNNVIPGSIEWKLYRMDSELGLGSHADNLIKLSLISSMLYSGYRLFSN